jgi:Ca2+ transporting ATPase
MKDYGTNNDVVKLVDDKKPEDKKDETTVNILTNNKGSFGISPKEIQAIINKYDIRNFVEEVEHLDSIGGNQGIEKLLKTSITSGISNDEVEKKERLDIYGTNAIEQEPLPHCCEYVWEALGDMMLRILIVAGILQIAIGASPLVEHPEKEWVEGMSIIVAVLVVVTVGSLTNYTKEKKFKELNDRNSNMIRITIKRNGESFECSPDDILVGDLVKISTGSIVPSDGILISTEGQVKLEESSLTGESDLIDKEPIESCMAKSKEWTGKDSDKHSIPSPMIFSGTQVKEGNGWFLAFAVGVSSKKGQIQQQVQQNMENEDSKTPLEAKLDKIASDIGWFGIFASVLTLISLLIRFGITYQEQKKAYDEYLLDPVEGQQVSNPKKTISSEILGIILLCIAIIVVAIPEGLPLAVTLSLAFSINKMMDDQNLVRKMHACETMGGANYICSDKTGTLTANLMNIFKVFNGSTIVDTKEVTSNKDNRLESSTLFSEKYYDLFSRSIACNVQMTVTEAELIIDPSKTDLAFANFLHNFSTNLYPIQSKYRVNTNDVKRIAFSSQRKKMSTILSHSDFPTGHRIIMKGAAEQVLKCCTNYVDPETLALSTISDEDVHKINNIIIGMASETLRTICVAYKDISESEVNNFNNKDDKGNNLVENSGFTMICIVGIKDTLREGVTDAIQKCHTAGINVVMVTGDLKDTAIAISKECGIWNLSQGAEIPENYSLTGEDFFKRIGGIECEICNKDIADCACPKTKRDALEKNIDFEKIQSQRIKDMKEFKNIVKDLRVLARSRPLDKYALVMGLRKLDNVVAVTGDGTNDAQALSKSDVGFAMGIEGTDVAKDAADIIILNDNFASIVCAVKWGRNIYDCIRKFIQFQLTVNITACVLVFICACVGNETPISAIQMLWLNMIMDSLGSMALATEPPHDNILVRKPNGRNEYIINYMMWKHIIGHSTTLLVILLVIYLHGPQFLKEDDPSRQAEADLVAFCYGVYPGRAPEGDTYYILSGSISDWKSKVPLVRGKTRVECGAYAGAQEMSLGLKTYINGNGNTSQMTIMFNIFVIYTLFNQINARVIDDGFNILYNISKNPYFVGLSILELGLQAILIQFGTDFFQTSRGGLTGKQWGYCFGFSAISFLVGFLLKLVKAEILIEKIGNCLMNSCGGNDGKVSDEILESEQAEERRKNQNQFVSGNLEEHGQKGSRSSKRRKSLLDNFKFEKIENLGSSKMRK